MNELEKEVERVCKHPFWRKITTSKIPTWVMKDGLEGVEIFEGKIRTFWLEKDHPDRIYGKPASELVSSIYQAFNEQKAVEKQELHHTAMMVEQVTPALMEKWRKMSVEDRMFLFQRTNPDMIEERPGVAGKKLSYVKGNVMIQELNIAFLFNWSSTIEEVKETETGYWVRGYIEVWMGQETGYVKRSAIGTADKHKGVNSEDVAKAAAMDMIKKSASFLGFNGDVYRGEI